MKKSTSIDPTQLEESEDTQGYATKPPKTFLKTCLTVLANLFVLTTSITSIILAILFIPKTLLLIPCYAVAGGAISSTIVLCLKKLLRCLCCDTGKQDTGFVAVPSRDTNEFYYSDNTHDDNTLPSANNDNHVELADISTSTLDESRSTGFTTLH